MSCCGCCWGLLCVGGGGVCWCCCRIKITSFLLFYHSCHRCTPAQYDHCCRFTNTTQPINPFLVTVLPPSPIPPLAQQKNLQIEHCAGHRLGATSGQKPSSFRTMVQHVDFDVFDACPRQSTFVLLFCLHRRRTNIVPGARLFHRVQ